MIVPGEGLRPEEIPDPQKAFSLEDILREAPQSFGRTNIRSERFIERVEIIWYTVKTLCKIRIFTVYTFLNTLIE